MQNYIFFYKIQLDNYLFLRRYFVGDRIYENLVIGCQVGMLASLLIELGLLFWYWGKKDAINENEYSWLENATVSYRPR